MKFPEKLLIHLFHTVNLSHVIFGVLCSVAGSLLKNGFPRLEERDLGQRINLIPIITIIIGCLILAVACLGFYAVLKQNNSFLVLYTNLLILIVVPQIAFLIWLYVYRSDIIECIIYEINYSWWEHFEVDIYQIRMNFIQNKLTCCGIHVPRDYITREREIPNSCCGPSTVECGNKTEIFMDRPGCIEAVPRFWEINLEILHYNGICNIAIEFLALILIWIYYIGKEFLIRN